LTYAFANIKNNNAVKMQPSLPRATYLALLLDAQKEAPVIGRTRLDKLLFLVQMRAVVELRIGIATDDYHFRSWWFGPFTEEIIDDLVALQTVGMVEVIGEDEETQEFRISEKGHLALENIRRMNLIPMPLLEQIEKIKSRYNRMNLEDLMRSVYNDYPQFTERSRIRDSLM